VRDQVDSKHRRALARRKQRSAKIKFTLGNLAHAEVEMGKPQMVRLDLAARPQFARSRYGPGR
jgi:hypothetical protein